MPLALVDFAALLLVLAAPPASDPAGVVLAGRQAFALPADPVAPPQLLAGGLVALG